MEGGLGGSGQGAGGGRAHAAGHRQGWPHPPPPDPGPSLRPQPQAPLEGPGEQAHPPEDPREWRGCGQTALAPAACPGPVEARVRGRITLGALPAARPRGTQALRATCAQCRPSAPWRNGGGLGSARHREPPSSRGVTPGNRGPRASPAVPPSQEPRRQVRAPPDASAPAAAKRKRPRREVGPEAHAGPGAGAQNSPQASVWSRRPATPWGGRILKKRDSSSDPAGHLSLRWMHPERGSRASDSSQTSSLCPL